MWTDQSGSSHQLGGGNLVQTYLWKEPREVCPFPSILFYSDFVENLRIYTWDQKAAARVTDPIRQWGESW